jgi:hypothetical protein
MKEERKMANLGNTDTETIERAFQAHIADFNACKQELTLHINMQNHLINYAIVIVAGTVTLFTLDKQNLAIQTPLILLIGSLLMSAIDWALMEASIGIANLASYIEYTLAPKVRQLINQKGQPEFDVLRWEEYAGNKNRLAPWVVMGLGKYAISYIPSVAFIVVFYFNKKQASQAWDSADIILFWFAVLATLAVPTMSLFRLKARGKQNNLAR